MDEVVFALDGDLIPIDGLDVAQIGILLDQDRSSLDVRQRPVKFNSIWFD